jgi:hypothetical protein
MRRVTKKSGSINRFCVLIVSMAKQKNAELEVSKRPTNNSGNKVDSMVHLLENWKSACEAMGSPFKATYACLEFEESLDQKEKNHPHRYQCDIEVSLRSESSEENTQWLHICNPDLMSILI